MSLAAILQRQMGGCRLFSSMLPCKKLALGGVKAEEQNWSARSEFEFGAFLGFELLGWRPVHAAHHGMEAAPLFRCIRADGGQAEPFNDWFRHHGKRIPSWLNRAAHWSSASVPLLEAQDRLRRRLRGRRTSPQGVSWKRKGHDTNPEGFVPASGRAPCQGLGEFAGHRFERRRATL